MHRCVEWVGEVPQVSLGQVQDSARRASVQVEQDFVPPEQCVPLRRHGRSPHVPLDPAGASSSAGRLDSGLSAGHLVLAVDVLAAGPVSLAAALDSDWAWDMDLIIPTILITLTTLATITIHPHQRQTMTAQAMTAIIMASLPMKFIGSLTKWTT